ncbi:hypothetical protein G6F65_018667 [Rhizopus arrhizus]|nr:hypothetical protein G6F65_018667 [Rhizopus arrhizus]
MIATSMNIAQKPTRRNLRHASRAPSGPGRCSGPAWHHQSHRDGHGWDRPAPAAAARTSAWPGCAVVHRTLRGHVDADLVGRQLRAHPAADFLAVVTGGAGHEDQQQQPADQQAGPGPQQARDGGHQQGGDQDAGPGAQRSAGGERPQRGAGGHQDCQQHAGQHDFAPVIVVGKHPGQDGQGHQREGGGHLDHGDHQGAALFGGDDPGGGDGLRPGAQVGEQVGDPDDAERGEG